METVLSFVMLAMLGIASLELCHAGHAGHCHLVHRDLCRDRVFAGLLGDQVMPRPKTELTGNSKFVGIRLTPSQYAKWIEIGGPKWLRQQLAKLMEQQRLAA